MRNNFLTLILVLSCLSTLSAQNKTEKWTINGICTEVEFFTPLTVKIVKYPEGNTNKDESLTVIAEPENVKTVKTNNSLSSKELTVKIDLKTGALSFIDSKGNILLREKSSTFEAIQKGNDKGKFKFKQSFLLDKDEPVYGLGTIQDGLLNRRNAHILMEQSNLQDFQNVLQSIKGYGIFWDNYSPTQFDGEADGITFTSEVGNMENYFFMYGKNADGVIAQMRKLTGQVPMFPLWTFGFWQSKERYKSSKELLEVVDKYRELNVPLDGIIQDWQYWGSNYLWNAMDFLSEDFSDAEHLAEKVHNKNAHLMISIWASFGPHTKAFKELNDKGLLFDFQTWPQSGISHIWPPRMDYPSGVKVYDAFSKEARDIYWKNLKTLYDYDIDAWWMDSTDPDCFYPSEEDYQHKAGENGTWRSLRNAFPLMTVKGVYESQRALKGKKRVFIMTRSAFAGQQHYGSNMWSGDVNSTWDMLRKQIPAGLNFTLTGNPNFNTDIGGFFCGSYNTKGNGSAPQNPQYQELYVRWMQYGLFCPVFRSHGADAPREIWQFGKKGEPVYDAIEKTIRLRYRLIPYFYSLAWQATNQNGSYLRALFYDFADDKNVWEISDEFLCGSQILALPIVKAQYTEEKIIKTDEMSGWNKQNSENGTLENVDFTKEKQVVKYLPKGCQWYNFNDNTRYQGGQEVTIKSTLNEVPMFIKAGSILPLAPEMQYVNEKPWDDLEIRIYPGANGAFTLYEDQGDGYDYENGAYSTITFTWNDKSKTLTIGKRFGNFPGMISSRKFTIKTPEGKLKTVNYNGNEIKVKL